MSHHDDAATGVEHETVSMATYRAECDRQDKQFWEIERLTAEVEKLTKERDDFRDALRRLGCVC